MCSSFLLFVLYWIMLSSRSLIKHVSSCLSGWLSVLSACSSVSLCVPMFDVHGLMLRFCGFNLCYVYVDSIGLLHFVLGRSLLCNFLGDPWSVVATLWYPAICLRVLPWVLEPKVAARCCCLIKVTIACSSCYYCLEYLYPGCFVVSSFLVGIWFEMSRVPFS